MKETVSIGLLVVSSVILTILTASPISHAQPIQKLPEFPSLLFLIVLAGIISLSIVAVKRIRVFFKLFSI